MLRKLVSGTLLEAFFRGRVRRRPACRDVRRARPGRGDLHARSRRRAAPRIGPQRPAPQRASAALRDRGHARRQEPRLRRPFLGRHRALRSNRHAHAPRQRARVQRGAPGSGQRQRKRHRPEGRARPRGADRAPRRPRPDRARPASPGFRLHRPDPDPGLGPVRARLPRQAHRRGGARPVHPVRGPRRAPLRPDVRRAELQGDLRPLGDRPRRPDGRQQHARPARGAASRRPQAGHLRHQPEDVELPAVLRPRRFRAALGQGPRRGRRRHRQPGRQRRAGAPRARFHRAAARVLHRLFRRPLSATQARQRRRPRPVAVLRRDGELGRDPHLRALPAGRPDDHRPGHAELHVHRARARNRAPVVRQHRDDGLVGRPLAQRRFRELDGDQGQRALPARLVPARHPRQRARIGDESRRLFDHAPGHPDHPHRFRDQPGVRRDLLFEGRGGHRHARGLRRRGRVARWHPRLHPAPSLRQHDQRRLVARRRTGRGDRARRHRARFHPPARHPAGPGRKPLRERHDSPLAHAERVQPRPPGRSRRQPAALARAAAAPARRRRTGAPRARRQRHGRAARLRAGRRERRPAGIFPHALHPRDGGGARRGAARPRTDRPARPRA